MTVEFYYNSSENNVVNKNITALNLSVNAVAKDAVSVTDPVLLLNYNSSYIANANYCYIPEYNRYYYIENVVNMPGGMCAITLRVDVLESFKNNIKSLTAVINKQETQGNLYYNDGSLKVLSTEFLQTYNFPNGFDDSGKFILITCGG